MSCQNSSFQVKNFIEVKFVKKTLQILYKISDFFYVYVRFSMCIYPISENLPLQTIILKIKVVQSPWPRQKSEMGSLLD